MMRFLLFALAIFPQVEADIQNVTVDIVNVSPTYHDGSAFKSNGAQPADAGWEAQYILFDASSRVYALQTHGATSNDCAAAAGSYGTKDYADSDIVIHNRKSHTRLQYQVDYWVPTQFQQNYFINTSISSSPTVVNCVLYQASQVASFKWSRVGGATTGTWAGDIVTQVDAAQAAAAQRIFCDSAVYTGAAANYAMSLTSGYEEAEIQVSTSNFDNENQHAGSQTMVAQPVIRALGGCGGEYNFFTWGNDNAAGGICFVSVQGSQVANGALFCLNDATMGQMHYFYSVSQASSGRAFVFYDYEGGGGAGNVITADGQAGILCKVQGDPLEIEVTTATGVTSHSAGETIYCTKQDNDWEAVGSAIAKFEPGESNNEQTADGQSVTAGAFTVSGNDVASFWSDGIAQDGPGVICSFSQIVVAARSNGSDSERYVVYGVCQDGSMTCIGATASSVETPSNGCYNDTSYVVQGSVRTGQGLIAFKLTGFFIETDQTYQEDDNGAYEQFQASNGANSLTNGVASSLQTHRETNGLSGNANSGLYDGTYFAIGCGLDLKNPAGVSSGEVSVLLIDDFLPSGNDVSLNGTTDSNLATAANPAATVATVSDARCGEYVVCAKASTEILVLLTVTGRVLVNSRSLQFPYKYGVIFVITPLRTSDMDTQHAVSPDGIIDGQVVSSGRNANKHLPNGVSWLIEQGYDSYANATEPLYGVFYSVMTSNTEETGAPRTAKIISVVNMRDADASSNFPMNLNIVFNPGNFVKNLLVTPGGDKWKDNSGFDNAVSYGLLESNGNIADGSDGSDDDYDSDGDGDAMEEWQAGGDIVGECKLTQQAQINTTFCLSSVGLCLFYFRPESTSVTLDAAGASAELAMVGVGATAVGAAATSDANSTTSSQLNNITNKDSTCVVAHTCGGCWYLTGIDGSQANLKNNDFFFCNANILVITYSNCHANSNSDGRSGQGQGFEVTETAGSVKYSWDNIRNSSESSVFKTGSDIVANIWNYEFYCECTYATDHTLEFATTADSGSLGHATANETYQDFVICATVLGYDDSRNPFDVFNLIKQQQLLNDVDESLPYVKSKTCTQQTQTYGDTIDVADIPDDEYILVVSADPKALASGMSFRTSVVIFPSNHTNQCHGRFGGGGADGCGWDFENAPMESTGVVNNNCCTSAGFQAGYEYFSSADLGTCLERATLGTSLNQESSMFAVRFKAAAWHGYNAMVLNVQAQFCYTGTDNGAGQAVPCLQCSSVAALNLDIPYFCNQTGPSAGAGDADNYTGCDVAGDWDARRRLEESLPAQDIQVSLKMLNPKYIIDTENTPFEDGMAAFDNAAAFAVILGFLSLLF